MGLLCVEVGGLERKATPRPYWVCGEGGGGGGRLCPRLSGGSGRGGVKLGDGEYVEEGREV